ncbi:Glucomannan 4-beta-mannosyltransferase protein [Dioscorea alata]|uniref:Glucomannan 4-beta-mannosyltransferase protein n=2 Tax=Dioscorea alata TaxID=55571 RepID=A0ACB7U7X3_DIOAL|nr:Glucomannan 4-beta-mannosyltransferase protein [Dioscorea alata]
MAAMTQTVMAVLVQVWNLVRVTLVVPLLRLAIFLSLATTVMILVEKVFAGIVSLVVKIFSLKPEKRYRWEPMRPDLETGNLAYPMVLIQIPMYNEKEVYKLSIGAACCLDWPSDRMIIQVLDDSTDLTVKDLVKLECENWKSKGVNITYEVRNNRQGYKAGALKEGMKHDYVQECDYVAIFDADFQPESDFLMRTIPFLVYNPDIALVQARWKFVNADECMMTRIQEMSLNYHFKIEQEAGSSTFAFFGFNGVWRIKAIDNAGGWKDRTTVEDMDLAVRAGLEGWKFVYVGDVHVKSELPSTFKAYRNQQHRWSCGPANLLKKMAMEIMKNEKVSIWKKFHMLYSFFFLGKIVIQTATFIFYCVVIPVSVLVPEVEIPQWGVVYIPTLITVCIILGTPSSIHLVIFWLLFQNVMSLHRIKAALTGLLDAGRVNEWIVTEKLGNAHKPKSTDQFKDSSNTQPLINKPKTTQTNIWQRYYFSEIWVGLFLLSCGCFDIATRRQGYFIYLILQGIAFLIAGFGYVGTYVPGS